MNGPDFCSWELWECVSNNGLLGLQFYQWPKLKYKKKYSLNSKMRTHLYFPINTFTWPLFEFSWLSIIERVVMEKIRLSKFLQNCMIRKHFWTLHPPTLLAVFCVEHQLCVILWLCSATHKMMAQNYFFSKNLLWPCSFSISPKAINKLFKSQGKS